MKNWRLDAYDSACFTQKKLKGREQHHTDRGSLTLITLVRFLFLFLVRKGVNANTHVCCGRPPLTGKGGLGENTITRRRAREQSDAYNTSAFLRHEEDRRENTTTQ